MADVLSVSSLNLYVKSLLDSDINLSNIAVEGELSNFKKYPSGHCYFTLKDETSQLKGVMFSSYVKNLGFKPDNGMKVIVRGTVSIYERDGAYQIYVTNMFQSGDGVYRLAFERLKNKLEKEGLFDSSHKKKLPKFPLKIGIATSPKGAAFHDIISVAQRRFPCVEIILAPCLVQGTDAPKTIIEAISALDSRDDIDLIIITRGGGSKEDLWCFNDEEIARRAYSCKKPTISAVGHEIDFSILDFVCDYRAATPTRAAEIALPDLNSILMKLASEEKLLSNQINSVINNYSYTLTNLRTSKGFRSFENKLSFLESKLAVQENNMKNSIDRKIEIYTNEIVAKTEIIENLSPLANLKRGYSLVYGYENTVKSDNFTVGENIKIITDKKILSATIDTINIREDQKWS